MSQDNWEPEEDLQDVDDNNKRKIVVEGTPRELIINASEQKSYVTPLDRDFGYRVGEKMPDGKSAVIALIFNKSQVSHWHESVKNKNPEAGNDRDNQDLDARKM
tara:strand:+ start:1192 stop:1503 length:312 start_codon:yes stop_codon:yes gene_type:complete